MAARRQLISSGGPFEAKYGYSRAVRVGDHVAVAGTAAFKDGAPVAPGDAAAQTRHILGVMEQALAEAGASLGDVVRYRVFVTDIADFDAVATELGKVFFHPPRRHPRRQQHHHPPRSRRRDRDGRHHRQCPPRRRAGGNQPRRHGVMMPGSGYAGTFRSARSRTARRSA